MVEHQISGQALMLRLLPSPARATCAGSRVILQKLEDMLASEMPGRGMAAVLLPHVKALAVARRPDFSVRRADGADRIYLRRWWLVPRGEHGGAYLHQMILDDDAVLHDHPYRSVSLALSEGLTEIYQETPPEGPRMTRRVGAGDIVARGETLAHQLMIDEGRRGDVWTIFVTGPRVRDWGFWCPRGWRLWSDYVATNQDPSVRHGGGTSGVGYGCGEEPLTEGEK